jgi:hypothetical protein
MVAARIAALVVTSVCFAQSPTDLFTKAPPAVDDALRARVTKFYELQGEGKFRLAERLVAEESKDIYFEADKRRCRKFEVVKLNYNEGFDKATAVVNCHTEILLPPKGLVSVTLPLTTFWKIADKDWYWYVPPRDALDSPFGKMKAGPGEGGGGELPHGPSVKDLMKMVTAEPAVLRLAMDVKQVRTVTVTNRMEGPVELELEPIASKDVTAKLARKELKANESTELEITFTPSGNARFGSSEDVRVKVKPTNSEILVRVVFLQH